MPKIATLMYNRPEDKLMLRISSLSRRIVALRLNTSDYWKIHRSSIVLFKDSLKDPTYCSLGFLGTLVKRRSRRIQSWTGDNKVENGMFIMNVLTV